ncbi:hypothetical protein CC86DRAFT_410900 [Ophiobolus disseminans]|uniref:Uncharacterized protein n=1 Tax=Ophiobolus disseminans TaxID=1469910 RepID=A0A6A6ZL39_9PLEO|nr:hypothetical protein CC86DRAFT_410900 [Ophiobolus disseminans]
MVNAKRKSLDNTEVPTKRARSSLSSSSTPALTEDQLNDMSKQELVLHSIRLQEQLTSALSAVPKPKSMSTTELVEKSIKARNVLSKGIEKQMKWTPSCKLGKSHFVYDGQVTDERIFKPMLGLPASHDKKAFKMSASDFDDKVGSPQASVRYGWLEFSGKTVNIRWDPEEKSFKVSGTWKEGVMTEGNPHDELCGMGQYNRAATINVSQNDREL